MPRITDYSFLFQNMPGASKKSLSPIPLSSLSGGAMQAQLRAAGIDTGSKQYKAVISSMMEAAKAAGKGEMYTNIQAIKNQLKYYDKDGDYIDPTTGLAGLLLTDANRESSKRIISIPESSREEMFELTKKEFLRENGVCNGDTTKRSDVYTNLHKKMKKNDRLAAGHTLEQYERQYRQAMYDAAKAADPNWQIGDSIKPGALDSVTRESVEAQMKKSGNKFTTTAMDVRI